MSIDDFIIDISGVKCVITLDGTRVQSICNYGADHIFTEHRNYFFYPEKIINHWSYDIMKELDCRYLLWGAKEWNRQFKILQILYENAV